MLAALEGAGLEFIAAGAKSLSGGAGVHSQPKDEPEVAAAKEADEMELDRVAEAVISIAREWDLAATFYFRSHG